MNLSNFITNKNRNIPVLICAVGKTPVGFSKINIPEVYNHHPHPKILSVQQLYVLDLEAYSGPGTALIGSFRIRRLFVSTDASPSFLFNRECYCLHLIYLIVLQYPCYTDDSGRRSSYSSKKCHQNL